MLELFFSSSHLTQLFFVLFAENIPLFIALSLLLGSPFLLPLFALLLLLRFLPLSFAVAIGNCFAIGDGFAGLLG